MHNAEQRNHDIEQKGLNKVKISEQVKSNIINKNVKLKTVKGMGMFQVDVET